MSRVYTNIVDEVTKRTFDVLIPESYRFHPVREDRVPIYQPTESNEKALSKLTLRHIVDMCFHHVEFTICKPTDTTTMVEILQNYLNHMAAFQTLDEETQIFVERVKLTIQTLTPFVERRRTLLKNTKAIVFRPNRLQDLFDSLRRVQTQAVQSITQAKPPVTPQ